MNLTDFKQNISLKNYCSFKIGGNAKYLFEARNIKELLNAIKCCKNNNINFKVIGLGANLLFDDLGFNGAIIVNRTNKCRFVGTSVYCESGLPVSNLINKCYLKSLTGIENLAGIPSTIGGATVNSLGAFETNFADFVEYVKCVNVKNLEKILKLSQKDCKFAYRDSLFKNGDYIILSVKLKLMNVNKSLIKTKILETIKKKTTNQPLNYPNAGSIFKRIGNFIPAKIIDELGLKGKKIGGAQISTKHAGFIINKGNATCKNVKELISFVENEVFLKTNVKLEKEIEFVSNNLNRK